VLAIVLALASAIGYGGSDFAAGLASRSAGVIQVTLLASMVSAVIVAAALPFAASHPPGTAALAWGAVAGLGGTTGALALYLGFRHAAFSVAGPISAVGAAGFSVLAGLLLGERPTALALTGIVLALPAIVGVSASAASADSEPPEEAVDADAAEETADADAAERPDAAGRPAATGSPATGVAAGLVAGAGFALLFIGLDRAGSGSGLWPVAATQVTELVVALAVATVTRNVRLPGTRRRGTQPSGTRRPGAQLSGAQLSGTQLSGAQLSGAQLSGTGPRLLAVIAGAAGASGTILFFFASHEGFLAITAVLTSLYPAVTIVLARTMLGERLTALRLAGLTLAGACVALIAVGSVG
jgi:drug/metabolite transporter (DMT)-like permease